MWDEYRLRVFENRVLRRIFGPKREEDGPWEKLHDELHSLYFSPNIFRLIKSRRMRWAGHVVCTGEGRDVYRFSFKEAKGNKPMGSPRRRWEDTVKMGDRDR
jgi:hypothetical protein